MYSVILKKNASIILLQNCKIIQAKYKKNKTKLDFCLLPLLYMYEKS